MTAYYTEFPRSVSKEVYKDMARWLRCKSRALSESQDFADYMAGVIFYGTGVFNGTEAVAKRAAELYRGLK